MRLAMIERILLSDTNSSLSAWDFSLIEEFSILFSSAIFPCAERARLLKKPTRLREWQEQLLLELPLPAAEQSSPVSLGPRIQQRNWSFQFQVRQVPCQSQCCLLH